jgi:ubiquitin C-terminal hydrolase
LLEKDRQYKFKRMGYKGVAALENIMNLATHTEIQALVDHEINKTDKIIGYAFSTKLPCANCATFLAYTTDTLFNGCQFVGVRSFGATHTTMHEYPWEIKGLQFPCSFKLGSDKKCPNTIVPVIISYAYPEALTLGANFMDTDAKNYTEELNLVNFPFSSNDLEQFQSAPVSGDSLAKAQPPASSAKSDLPKQVPLSLDDIAKKEINSGKNLIPKNMVGLEWFKNHCYANAAFQLLFACKPISDFIHEYSGEDTFVKSLKVLFQAMEKSKGKVILSENNGDSIGLKTIYTLIGQEAKNTRMSNDTVLELGTSEEQKDVPELLDCAIEAILASEKTQNEQLKAGLTTDFDSIRTCPKCHKHSTSTEAYNTLQVVLPEGSGGQGITRCIEKTFESEKLDENNMWNCTVCGEMVQATKTSHADRLPDTLIIQLKRFCHSNLTKRISKKCNPVYYNKILKFPENLLSERLKASDSSGVYYKLKGVINHVGSIESGHYTATILKSEDDKWYTANGASIKLQSKTGEFECSDDAYIFMYEKIYGSKVKPEDYEEKVEDDSHKESGDMVATQSEGKKDAETQTPVQYKNLKENYRRPLKEEMSTAWREAYEPLEKEEEIDSDFRDAKTRFETRLKKIRKKKSSKELLKMTENKDTSLRFKAKKTIIDLTQDPSFDKNFTDSKANDAIREIYLEMGKN